MKDNSNSTSRPLKVGFFCDTFYPMVDGVVKVVDNYATILSKTCEVTVFVPEGRKKFDDSKFPYKVVRCKHLRVFGMDYDLPAPNLDRKFMHELKHADLDIVHVHSIFTLGKVGLKYARKHGIPSVGTMHSQFKQDFERNLKGPLMKPVIAFMMWNLRRFFNSTTVNWTVNKEVARIFHEDYGVRSCPEIVPNGTEMLPFTDKAYIDGLRAKYGIAPDCKVLLFVGRINLLKNLKLLMHSMAELKDMGFPFRLILVGGGQDKGTIKRLSRKLGVAGSVIWGGVITDRQEMAAHYALADLFVFPSLYDASSLVQVEAASQSTPTLFVEGAATASTVTPDVNGYVAPNNAADYAKKIQEIFSDPAKYAEISANAHRDLYVTWNNVVAMVLGKYKALIR